MPQQLLPQNAIKRHNVNPGTLVERLCLLALQDNDKQAAVMACESLITIVERIKQESAKRRGDSKWHK